MRQRLWTSRRREGPVCADRAQRVRVPCATGPCLAQFAKDSRITPALSHNRLVNRAKWDARSRSDQGAAAVEFALVSVILFPLILGMVQYGLLFNDFLQVRQGVRNAARTASVKTPVTCGTSTTYADQVACYAKEQISPVSGRTAVKVVVPGTWLVGQPVLVCAVTKSAAANAGVMPVPSAGWVRAATQMSIEQSTAPTGTFPSYASDFTSPPDSLPVDADPSGASWGWCS